MWLNHFLNILLSALLSAYWRTLTDKLCLKARKKLWICLNDYHKRIIAWVCLTGLGPTCVYMEAQASVTGHESLVQREYMTSSSSRQDISCHNKTQKLLNHSHVPWGLFTEASTSEPQQARGFTMTTLGNTLWLATVTADYTYATMGPREIGQTLSAKRVFQFHLPFCVDFLSSCVILWMVSCEMRPDVSNTLYIQEHLDILCTQPAQSYMLHIWQPYYPSPILFSFSILKFLPIFC